MKTLPTHTKAIITAAVLTVFFASGCERRTPDETGAAGTSSSAPSSPGISGSSPSAPPAVTNDMPAAPSPSDAASTASADAKTAGSAIDDTIITTKVKTALLADSDIKGLGIDVDTAGAIVTLSGAVANQTQIDRAAKVAADVHGVNSVVNNLTIKK